MHRSTAIFVAQGCRVPHAFPMRPTLAACLVLCPLAAPSIRAEVSFEKEVLPLLESKCLDCHRAEFEKDGRTIKPKAGLRLDAAWAILAGGESGPAVAAGRPEESLLLERVSLPPDDEDHMPPADKGDPLTDAERDLLAAWIQEGAKFGEWVGNLEGRPEEAAADPASKPAPISERQMLYERLASGLEPLPREDWTAVEAAGGRVVPLSPTSPLLSVDFRLSPEGASDEQILTALPIASHIAHLDLSRTAATAAALDLARKAPRLVRLDLGATSVGDEAVGALSGLKELRYLNLHRTQVGDEGLRTLGSIASLEAVYLWESQATEPGLARLRKALPNAKIRLK